MGEISVVFIVTVTKNIAFLIKRRRHLNRKPYACSSFYILYIMM